MKLKAVVPDNCPKELIEALNKMRPAVMERVIGPHLKRPDFGPAEMYVQVCDIADGDTHKLFCEARLTGVSLADDRSKADFRNARAELERIYKELIQMFLPVKKEMQLYVQIYLDEAIDGSTIVEQGPAWIQGMRQVEPLHG